MSAVCETALGAMPPGTTLPMIVSYNATNVPFTTLNVYSDSLSEQQLFDYGANFMRLRLSSIQGISVPIPFGGRLRSIMVNLNRSHIDAAGLLCQDLPD